MVCKRVLDRGEQAVAFVSKVWGFEGLGGPKVLCFLGGRRFVGLEVNDLEGFDCSFLEEGAKQQRTAGCDSFVLVLRRRL